MAPRLIYSPQCPNCQRFIGALDRTSAKTSVMKISVASLAPEQRKVVTAVPMLVMDDGSALVGTKAFEWLKQFEGDMEMDSFNGSGGLGFAAFGDDDGTIMHSTAYSAFEPVP